MSCKTINSGESPEKVPQFTRNFVFTFRKQESKYYVAYIIFYFLGMTTLIPWNFFITADEYWMYKFRDVNGSSPDVHDNSSVTPRTTLQKNFTAYLSVASTLPSTIFLILNSALTQKISIHTRILGSLFLILGLFIATTVFVKINTDSWQYDFFYLTMALVVFLNIASAVLTGGLFGILGKFSSAYISAASSGQALGGIFAAIAELVSLWLGASPQFSAFVYFLFADVCLILSIVLYILLIRAVFFKFHVAGRSQLSVQFEPGSSALMDSVQSCSYFGVIKKVWVHGFAVWMTFFITLCIYPAITVLVESQYKGNHNKWNDVYFVPVVAYLTFSTFDYLGRIVSGCLQLPRQNALALSIMSVLRVIFIPLLLFCNAQPRVNIPVYIPEDAYYILLVILFGFTNGYIVNLTMITAPKVCEHNEQEVAASVMAAFLGIGLACGSLVSMVLVAYL